MIFKRKTISFYCDISFWALNNVFEGRKTTFLAPPLSTDVALYRPAGYDVAYYVPPAFLTLFPFRMEPLCNSISAALAEHHEFITQKRGKTSPTILLQDHPLPRSSMKPQPIPPPAPLLFHVFSNNGYFNLCFLLYYIKHGKPNETYLLDLIRGTIVDSAPSHLTPEVLTRGMIGAFLSKPHVWNSISSVQRVREAQFCISLRNCLMRISFGPLLL
jgi:hypothetical protein